MSEYNIQMNKYNALNAEYDQLYPNPMKHANTHAKDGSDPITPASIGAYTKGEADTLLANKANSADLQSHITNKSNPHGVTAAQIGTYTKAETDTRLNARIDKSYGVNMIQDLSSTDDFGNKSCIFRVTGDTFGIFPGTYAPYARLRSGPNGSYDMWFGITSGNWLHYCKTSDGATPTSTSWVRVPKIAIGSYVGTGTYYSNNPNSLTFDFEPKVVIVVADGPNGLCAGFLIVRGQTYSNGIGSFSSSSVGLDLHITWSGNTVSWYTTNDFDAGKANAQMNTSGTTFRYVALG